MPSIWHVGCVSEHLEALAHAATGPSVGGRMPPAGVCQACSSATKWPTHAAGSAPARACASAQSGCAEDAEAPNVTLVRPLVLVRLLTRHPKPPGCGCVRGTALAVGRGWLSPLRSTVVPCVAGKYRTGSHHTAHDTTGRRQLGRGTARIRPQLPGARAEVAVVWV